MPGFGDGLLSIQPLWKSTLRAIRSVDESIESVPAAKEG